MNLFNSIGVKRPNRNAFNLSHDVKLTANIGDLVPILCQEVVPGDKFKINTEIMVRMAPMLAPVYHRVKVYTHYFFVPNRLLWSHWEDFITGGEDGTLTPAVPYVELQSTVSSKYLADGTLWDYMGAPSTGTAAQPKSLSGRFSLFPFKAYQLVYNEYYRDQNLTEPIEIYKDLDGKQALDKIGPTLLRMRKRAWEKDYFTSALPWTQRGGEVYLPLTGSAPVTSSNARYVRTSTGGAASGDVGLNNGGLVGYPGQSDQYPVSIEDGSMSADMSKVTSATINDLRRATRLQEFLEKSARGGSRYIEQILVHFGVRSKDARLQRPEYLGGGVAPVVLSEVLQTSEGTEKSPQGYMSGHGISVGNSNRISRSFDEHGIVLCIMSVLPRSAYQQGKPKIFSRFDKLDYYFPSFANLGEQAISNEELYCDNDDVYNKGTFGYTPRYAEYKFSPARVHGDFKNSLAYWHMGRIFKNKPSLTTDFVTVDSNTTDRVFAVQDASVNKLWIQVYHNFTAVRPMPKFGTPVL